MKECWINVYDQTIRPLYEFSAPHHTKLQAILCSIANATYCQEKLIYRLHVKMKEPKPKYEHKYYRKSLTTNWMDN